MPQQPATETATVVRSILDIWGICGEDAATMLRDAISIHHYKRNEIIYKDFDHPSHLYYLVRGKVKIYKDGINGRSQIIRGIIPSEMFGFRAYFANQYYKTSGKAIEACTVAAIPFDVVDRLMAMEPTVGRYLMSQLAIKLGDSDDRTVNLTQKHIRARLAEALLYLRDNYGLEEDGYTLSIYLSREDLANMANMTTSNAIRTLSAFAAEKLVAIDGRKIKFLAPGQLETISKNG